MPYIFKPPTYQVAIDRNRTDIIRYLNNNRGYAVRVLGSTVDTYPGVAGVVVQDFEDYDYVYLGGKKHTISDAEYTTLTTADARWDDHCEAI